MSDVIVCLGWGSLVWDPRSLPVVGSWNADGPLARLEFARQSLDNRITLVLVEDAQPVRTLWALIKMSLGLDGAAKSLKTREGTAAKYIGNWSRGEEEPSNIVGLENWANSHGVDSVVWTDLPPKFKGENHTVPTKEQVLEHFNSLPAAEFREAKRYVERAPIQIDTEYRRAIQEALGWRAKG